MLNIQVKCPNKQNHDKIQMFLVIGYDLEFKTYSLVKTIVDFMAIHIWSVARDTLCTYDGPVVKL